MPIGTICKINTIILAKPPLQKSYHGLVLVYAGTCGKLDVKKSAS